MNAFRDAATALRREHPLRRLVAAGVAILVFAVLGIGKAMVLCRSGECAPHVAMAHADGTCAHDEVDAAEPAPTCARGGAPDDVPHREALGHHHGCVDLALFAGATRSERSRPPQEGAAGAMVPCRVADHVRPLAPPRTPACARGLAPPRFDARAARVRTTELRI